MQNINFKRFICVAALVILCMSTLTGCKSYSKVSNALTQEFGTNLTATNTYKDNTLTYAVAKDNDNNFYRFTIDGQSRPIFSESYDKAVLDLKLKDEIAKYLSNDYLLFVQYNTNDLETCDIYLYTDYIVDLSSLTRNLNNISGLDVNKVVYHTASVDTKKNLDKLNSIIEKKLKEVGIFNQEVEEEICRHVRDYTLTNVD